MEIQDAGYFYGNEMTVDEVRKGRVGRTVVEGISIGSV